MKRVKRAKLLLPSLVALANVCACGGTSITGPDTSPSTSISGGGTTGEVYTDPPVGYPVSAGKGGASNPPPVGGGVAGAGTIPGGPACPQTIPVWGSSCDMNPVGTFECPFASSCGPVLAACLAGRWENLEGPLCQQGSTGGAAGVGGATGIAGEAGEAGQINIPTPLPLTCPAAIPIPGTFCYLPQALSSYRCDYADPCTPTRATCNGSWQVEYSFECAAGAGGI